MNTTLTDDEVGILLTAAVHAPSFHNTQPWRFEVHGPVIDVLLDEERMLLVEDPSGRSALISVGAAVFNVRVAAAMLGHESRFAPNPDPEFPEIVARVFLDDRKAPIRTLSSLYGEVRRRHTYRGPMLDQVIAPKVLQRLDEAALAEGARLHWLGSPARSQLGELLRRTDAEDLHDEDRLHERLRWIGGDRAEDGVEQSALGPVPVQPAFVRDLSAGFDTTGRGQALFETHPAVAVLGTRGEDTDAWVRAGLALQRVLLVATSYDLAASFLNQVLERTGPRFEVRELIGDRWWPQMVLRVGYPAYADGQTARRDWRASFDEWF